MNQPHGAGLEFWRGRRVFITGHTGFKGAWLSLWLAKVGAHVTAFSLAPPTIPNLFEQAQSSRGIASIHGDIRDFERLAGAIAESRASVVFHLAAQATVADGYREPRETFATNLTGTLNVLDTIRQHGNVSAAVIVTSDKCYAPSPLGQPLIEDSPMGGIDPYSASKSCAEIAVNSWRESFFGDASSCRVATARAGNVIGGGDWSRHRLLPDMVRAFAAGQGVTLRMPDAIRPWQHVLDGLQGYLLLAERLCAPDGQLFARGWNFGPGQSGEISVQDLANRAATLWGEPRPLVSVGGNFQKETTTLRLDPTRARKELGWVPRWNIDAALRQTIGWYKAWARGEDLREVTLRQIDDYMGAI